VLNHLELAIVVGQDALSGLEHGYTMGRPIGPALTVY